MIATEAVTAALGGNSPALTVTVVPVVTSLTEKTTADNVLGFETVRIVTYR